MGNKKFLFDVTFKYCVGDELEEKSFTESYYCTSKQLEENIEMIERLALHFKGRIFETNTLLKS